MVIAIIAARDDRDRLLMPGYSLNGRQTGRAVCELADGRPHLHLYLHLYCRAHQHIALRIHTDTHTLGKKYLRNSERRAY